MKWRSRKLEVGRGAGRGAPTRVEVSLIVSIMQIKQLGLQGSRTISSKRMSVLESATERMFIEHVPVRGTREFKAV